MEIKMLPPSDCYAAFARALRDGRLGSTSAVVESRRRFKDVRTESVMPIREMIALGSEPNHAADSAINYMSKRRRIVFGAAG
jgi:hypothetical protein